MKRILTPHFLKLFVLFIILLGFVFVYLAFIASAVPNNIAPLTEGSQYRVKIAPGSNVSSVAKQLVAQGVDTNVWKVQLISRGLFLGKKLKAGVYDFSPGASLGSILMKMGRGDSVKLSVTLVEGWTFNQFKAAVDAQKDLKKEAKGWGIKQILAAIEAKESHPEGLFFPDTYVYEPGDSDVLIYQRAYKAMSKKLAEAWDQRGSDSPVKTPYDLLKLASIVEKETGHSEDRGLVSAVFNNR
ncbi:MAG: hypothetical protein RLZZ410_1162, partial [Pseudomonadota bacterium]